MADTPHYKVRATSHPDTENAWLLSYGKGKKKLTAKVTPTSLGWIVSETEAALSLDAFPRLRDAKIKWGAWAASHYDGNSSPSPKKEGTTRSGPPKPPSLMKKKSGPPAFKRSGPPTHKAKTPENLDRQFESDPFSPMMRYACNCEDKAKRQQLTPLGVLVELQKFWLTHQEKGDMTIDKFHPIFNTVQACLARELKED